MGQYLASNVMRPSPDERYLAGERASRNGDHGKAVAYYTEVIISDPQNVKAHLQRGYSHAALKNHECAVADLSYVIEQRPEHVQALTSRGSAYTQLGKYEAAIADLDRAIELDPHNTSAFNDRGRAYKAMGNDKRACADWRTGQRLGSAEAGIILENNRCK